MNFGLNNIGLYRIGLSNERVKWSLGQTGCDRGLLLEYKIWRA
jgi:hypothetical protein